MSEQISTINLDKENDDNIRIKSEHREKRLSDRYDETGLQESERKSMREQISTINLDKVNDHYIRIRSELREKRLSERYDETGLQESEHKNMREQISTINLDKENDDNIRIKSEHREKRLSDRYDETTIQESRRKKLINTFYKSWIYISCIFVRLVFLVFLIIGIHFLKCVYDNWAFTLLYACPLLIILEGSYVLFKRNGYDPYWFSVSVASYLVGMSVIISYQGNFIYRAHNLYCKSYNNQTSSYADCLPISFNMCRFIKNVIVYFVLSLVFARWMLPQHKKITSEHVYQQIFLFTIVSADAIKLGVFMYKLENMYYLMKGIQISFSLSLVQFCFSLLAVTKRNYQLTGFAKFINILLSTEAWSLIFAILTQEIPAFVMRAILLRSLYGIVSDSLIFFTIKNFLLIVLFTYRAIKLIRVEYQLDKDSNERIQKTISN